MNSRYLVPPIAQILQVNSPAVRKNKKGAKAGLLWDNTAEVVLPKKFVPVQFYPEVIQWRDKDEGGGIIWRSRDLTDRKVQEALIWQTDKKGKRYQEAREYLNVVALFEGRTGPTIMSFSSTGLKDGKSFYSKAVYRPGNLWDTVYEWEAYTRSNDEGEWWAINIMPEGDSSKDIRALAENLCDIVEARGIEVEATHPEDQRDAAPRDDRSESQGSRHVRSAVASRSGGSDRPDYPQHLR
jgi:hypothetical protein